MFGTELADHIEIDHERELGGLGVGGYGRIGNIHAEMHRDRKDWGHKHTGKGIVWDNEDSNVIPFTRSR